MTEVLSSSESTPQGRGGCPVIHEEFFAPREVGSHWALGDRLREEGTVHWNTQAQGYWMFTGFEPVRDIYRQPDLFSSASLTPWDPNPFYRFIPTMVDAPDHLAYRRILNPWFTAQRVRAGENSAREICRRLVEETAAKGKTNFVKEFAMRYPTEVFLNFVGMDLRDAPKMLKWVEAFFDGYGGDPEAQQGMADGLQNLRDYWLAAVEERRGEAGPREGDFASYLVHSKFDGDRSLTDAELNDLLTLAVIGGLDTTRGQLGYMFRHLAMHPEDRRRLIDEPDIIPLAVEEVLRFYTITFGDGRKVTRDTEFHGAELKKGDMVWALVSSANRDPNEFERGNEFVIDRKRNNHVGFALGPHRCLGMHLARSSMKVAVEEWLKVVPEFYLDSDQVLMERGAGSMLSPLDVPLAWT